MFAKGHFGSVRDCRVRPESQEDEVVQVAHLLDGETEFIRRSIHVVSQPTKLREDAKWRSK